MSDPWHCWRVTKYDPANRSESGAYLADEWTGASHVGASFGGEALTLDAYEEVETRYLNAVRDFANEAGHYELQLVTVEQDHKLEGVVLKLDAVEDVARRILRGELWGRLQSTARDFYVHFGHDFYMFIGSRSPCPEAAVKASAAGLFVEPDWPSPYLELVEVTLMDHPEPEAVERLMETVTRDLATSGTGVLASHRKGGFSQAFRCVGISATDLYDAVRETVQGFDAGAGSYVYLEGHEIETKHPLA